MSLQMQVKLLRVLQERSFERVGSNRTIRCNVRIIAATHRDLDVAISAGRFREDLFYRLNVFPVQMPPLRDRLEDLPILIEHLVHRLGQGAGHRIRLDKEALNCLARYRWPGNVRELANLLERLAILYPQQPIGAADLPERYRIAGTGNWFGSGVQIVPPPEPVTGAEICAAPVTDAEEALDALHVAEILGTVEGALKSGGIDLKDHLSSIEIGLIRKALEEADGTVAGAARLLNIRRTTLVEKLRKYRLSA
jgi:sigma-54 specific flagellar transcriptional regulator A